MSRLKVQTLVLASRKEESDMEVNRFRVEPGSNRPSLVYICFSLSLCMVGAVICRQCNWLGRTFFYLICTIYLLCLFNFSIWVTSEFRFIGACFGNLVSFRGKGGFGGLSNWFFWVSVSLKPFTLFFSFFFSIFFFIWWPLGSINVMNKGAPNDMVSCGV